MHLLVSGSPKVTESQREILVVLGVALKPTG